MKLVKVPGDFSVLQFSADDPTPAWVQASRFFSISKTSDELSIVCETSVIPSGAAKVEVQGDELDMSAAKDDASTSERAPTGAKIEPGWKCLKVEGPLDFSLTGVLSSIARPLAEAKISIFAISTFDTDYILIKSQSLQKAKRALKEVGFDVDLALE